MVQIYCRDAADQVRQTQELEARTRDVGSDVDHISGYLVTNSSRYELHRTSFTRGDDDDDVSLELHRTSSSDADTLHVLQLRLSHLLVDGVLLHPVFRRRNSSTDCFRVSFALLFDPSTSRAL